MIEILAQIRATDSKPFTAGIVLFDDKVVEAAPIVRYMKGRTRTWVRTFCAKRKWEISVVWQMERTLPKNGGIPRGSE